MVFAYKLCALLVLFFLMLQNYVVYRKKRTTSGTCDRLHVGEEGWLLLSVLVTAQLAEGELPHLTAEK